MIKCLSKRFSPKPERVILSVITCGTVSLLYKRSNFRTSILSGSLRYEEQRDQKTNSWTCKVVEVSGHNLESSQTWCFCIQCFNYLCTYVLYGPVRDAFDAGSIHYEGKWEGGWPWKARFFLGPVKWHRADRRGPFGAQKTLDTFVPITSKTSASAFWKPILAVVLFHSM